MTIKFGIINLSLYDSIIIRNPKINIKILIIILVIYSILPCPNGCSLSAGFKDNLLPNMDIKSVVKSLKE